MTSRHVTCAACGLHIHAATLYDAWQLFDHHVDTEHGRRFPLGAHHVINTGLGPMRRARVAPLTPQGGS